MTEIRGEQNNLGRWFDVPESASPFQNFVAVPLLFLHASLTRAPIGCQNAPPPPLFKRAKKTKEDVITKLGIRLS